MAALKRSVVQNTPVEIRDGVSVTKLTIHAIVIEDEGIVINYTQGISKFVPRDEAVEALVASIESISTSINN
jgi:hypothetical protein